MNAITSFLDGAERLENKYPITYNALWIMLMVMSLVTWPLQSYALAVFTVLVIIEFTNHLRHRQDRLEDFEEAARFDAEDAKKGLKFGIFIGIGAFLLLSYGMVSILTSSGFFWHAIPLGVLTAQAVYCTLTIVKMHKMATSIQKGTK